MQPRAMRDYDVFIASPGDMDAERREVRTFFDEFNRHTAINWGVRFNVVDYENYSNAGVGRPQELITKQTLERFRSSLALVIGIMGQRFGTHTGAYESGTEEELAWALNSHRESAFPEIKWFFSNIETFSAPSDIEKIREALAQWEKVRAFRERLENSDPPLYYRTFTDTADFRDVLRKDLTLWLNDASRPWHSLPAYTPIRPASVRLTDLQTAYYQSLVEAFKTLDIAGIDINENVNIPLKDVYIRLRVIRGQEPYEGEDDGTLDGPLDIHSALDKYRRLVIVGDPGSGKSTFLKFIALIIARSKLEQNPALASTELNLKEPLPIPFFISLWELSDFIRKIGGAGEHTITGFIVSRLSEYGVSVTPAALHGLLEGGSCCILFDGLDEVPTENGRRMISRLVEQFVQRYEGNRFVVTSRVRGYTGSAVLKSGFVRCDVQNFDERDRREFLANWFAALLRESREEVLTGNGRGRRELETLSLAIQSKDGIRALAVNPLMMTVIAIVHWNRQRLPDQRVVLYDECVDVLLGQRKEAERTSLRRLADVLSVEEEDKAQFDRTWRRKRFAEIALRILESGSDEITRAAVIDLLRRRLRDRHGSDDERASIEAEILLDREELRSGLLVSRRAQSYRFVHLTFQEYLAAWHIAKQNLDVIKATVKSRLRDPRWFETLQLLGGEIARDDDDKLDGYVSFLLNSMGERIDAQARVIALCANILRDVKGTADINAPTQEKYMSALNGTLHAFRAGSNVPVKTQQEILRALIPLGASVKEHLIEATISPHYQIRAEALGIIAPHLPDDDLFSMSHVLKDRSQGAITTYLEALFARDTDRTLVFLSSKSVLPPKARECVLRILERAYVNVNLDSAFQVIASFVGESEHDGVRAVIECAIRLLDNASYGQSDLPLSAGWVDEHDVGFLNSMTHRRSNTPASVQWHDDKMLRIVSRIAIEGKLPDIRLDALKLLGHARQPGDEVWDIIRKVALRDKDTVVRLSALKILKGNSRVAGLPVDLACRMARQDLNEEIRLAALMILLKEHIDSASAWQCIADIAKWDRSPQARLTALEALVRHQKTPLLSYEALIQLTQVGNYEYVRSTALKILARDYRHRPETWKTVNRSAVDDDRGVQLTAISLLAEEGQDLSLVSRVATQIACNGNKQNRRAALGVLAKVHTEPCSVERIILTQKLDGHAPFIDPITGVDKLWVAQCADKLGEPFHMTWERFDMLAAILPLKVSRPSNVEHPLPGTRPKP